MSAAIKRDTLGSSAGTPRQREIHDPFVGVVPCVGVLIKSNSAWGTFMASMIQTGKREEESHSGWRAIDTPFLARQRLTCMRLLAASSLLNVFDLVACQ